LLGQRSEQSAIAAAIELERQIDERLRTSPRPTEPNFTAVEPWMLDLKLENWKARQR
jgi:hypothetical protein